MSGRNAERGLQRMFLESVDPIERIQPTTPDDPDFHGGFDGVASGAEVYKGIKRSGETQNRTVDTRIFSPLLYQLSYLAEVSVV